MPKLSDEDNEAIDILTNKYGDRLTEWEENFLATLVEQDFISEKQQEIFDRIWKSCANYPGRR